MIDGLQGQIVLKHKDKKEEIIENKEADLFIESVKNI